MSSAILLVAHGSRRANANAELVELAKLFRQRVDEEIVEIGYLELAEPTIPTGLRRCASMGATSIAILPYFLSQGAHVTEDLFEFQIGFRQEFPDIECFICPPIGLHSKVLDILLDRLAEGRAKHGR